VNWLYVQLSRARQGTRLYAVVGPEPQGAGELDLPDREQPDAYLQLAQALSRGVGQTLAIDTPSSLDLGRLSTRELRAERDRLRRQLDQAPRDRRRELARASAHREQAEQALAATSSPPAVSPPACFAGCAAAATSPPGCRVGWRSRLSRPTGPMTGSGSCASTSNTARAGWKPRPPRPRLPGHREDLGLAAPRHRSGVEADRPGYVLEALGPVPESTRGRRAWRQAAAEIEQYRRTYQITDPNRALGLEPQDPGQRAARQRPAAPSSGPGQAARGRPQPRPPADQRAPHPAATSPAARPIRPRARRRLAPPEGSTPDGQSSTVALRRR
jgi:hypothetical protein